MAAHARHSHRALTGITTEAALTSGDHPMNTPPRQPQAPESYATFWEPVAVAPAPGGAPNVGDAPVAGDAGASDAYLQFVNVTEGAPITPPPARA
jgi:hypothetical protein